MFFRSKEKEKKWEFWDVIKIISQIRIQSEVDLHKLGKKMISASWKHNYAWMNYEQQIFTRFTTFQI
jgi:hypothetical protein